MTNEEKKAYIEKINASLAENDDLNKEETENADVVSDELDEDDLNKEETENEDVVSDELDEDDLSNEETNNKKSKVILGVAAGATIAAMAIAIIVTAINSSKKGLKTSNNDKKNNGGNSSVTTMTPESDSPTTTTRKVLSDLGIEAELPTVTNKPIVQNPSNDKIDVNKVVEADNGDLFVDKENKDKYEQAKEEQNATVTKDKNGNEVIVSYDTGKDEYVKDGNVYKKDENYEIKDKTGNTIQEGKVDSNTGLPDGYIYENDRIIPESDAGKYVVLESDYYFGDQKVYNKGEKVTKETYEDIKKQFTTTPTKTTTRVENEFIPNETVTSKVTTTAPKKTTTPKVTTAPNKQETPTQTTTTPKKTTTTTTTTTTVYVDEEGVINKDGTYTIYGTTYKSKADFEQFIIDPDSYGLYNGVIMPLEDIEKINASKSR